MRGAQLHGFHQCECRISSTPASGKDLRTCSLMLHSLFPIDYKALFFSEEFHFFYYSVTSSCTTVGHSNSIRPGRSIVLASVSVPTLSDRSFRPSTAFLVITLNIVSNS